MGIGREREPERKNTRGQGGEPTGTPPNDHREKTQRRTVKVDNMMLKDELALHQSAADGLTQAGLGTYSFAVAEQQIAPATGKTIEKDSPFVLVTYSGLENRDILWNLVGRAKYAKQNARLEGKSTEEIDRAVQDEIKAGIDLSLKANTFLRQTLDSQHRKSGQ